MKKISREGVDGRLPKLLSIVRCGDQNTTWATLENSELRRCQQGGVMTHQGIGDFGVHETIYGRDHDVLLTRKRTTT